MDKRIFKLPIYSTPLLRGGVGVVIKHAHMSDNIHNWKHLKEKRRQLRNHGTPAEATLWKLLSNSRLEGRKFRRQHSIKNYIVDFYCHSERLAIELDGDVHFSEESLEYDKKREADLAAHGIRVIRFENEDVFRATVAVLEKIKSCFGRNDHP